MSHAGAFCSVAPRDICKVRLQWWVARSNCKCSLQSAIAELPRKLQVQMGLRDAIAQSIAHGSCDVGSKGALAEVRCKIQLQTISAQLVTRELQGWRWKKQLKSAIARWSCKLRGAIAHENSKEQLQKVLHKEVAECTCKVNNAAQKWEIILSAGRNTLTLNAEFNLTTCYSKNVH